MSKKPTYEELEKRVNELVEEAEKRERAERAFRENQELINLLTEQTLLSIVILQDERIVYTNNAYSELTGYPVEEIQKWGIKDTIDLIHPDFKKFVISQGRKKMKGNVNGIVTNYQYKGIKNSGKEGWVDQYSKTILFNGKPADMICLIEITDRKQAEEMIRERERRFRDLAEMLPEAVFETDAEMNLIYSNKQSFSLFGYSKEDFEMGLNALEMLIPEDRKRAQKNITKRLRLGKIGMNEYSGLRKDGSTFPVLLHTSPIMNQGAFDGLRGIIIDISARKQMEAQLQQTQKIESIGNLAGGIAHDFNNILFPIVGMSEMLMEDLPSGSPEYQSVKEILKASIRGGELVKQILAFSRQSDHQMIPVRLQQILKDALKLCRSTIPSNIEIKQNIQSDSGMVVADPTQMHQIVMNLITNAYHAVESTGGNISVMLKETVLSHDNLVDSVLKPGRYSMLSISDTGCGIDQSIMDKIFEPYFTTKDKGKGTGLGLAVVYGIVKEHSGDIKISSEIMKGTTVDVFLPLIEDSSENEPIEKSERLQTGTERILLVDDEESIARLEKQMLERLGYRVTSRTSSLDALEAFRANPGDFDLVISDMNMPNMTGDQLAKELLSIRPGIPIIVCTGFSEKLNNENIQAYGIRSFLMKPVVMSKMADITRKVLDETKTCLKF